jgi:hypothetical protein
MLRAMSATTEAASELAGPAPHTSVPCVVPRETPLRVLGGSRGRFSRMDFRIRQTSAASPAEPGGLLSY